MSGILFPYAAIERLWCQLEELKSAGHMLDQCEKLMNLLRGALLIHLKQVGKTDCIFSHEDLDFLII